MSADTQCRFKPNTSREQHVGNEGAKVRRENGRIWIEGIPNLSWGKGKDNTFIGSLEAALSVTQFPFSFRDLMVYSGIAFRVRWYQGDNGQNGCGSSAVGEFPYETYSIQRLTGWQLDVEFVDNLSSMRKRIMESIDQGWPVLVYDPGWDVALCVGYMDNGNTLLLNTYSDTGQPEMTPSDLSGLCGFLTGKSKGLSNEELHSEVLKHAIGLWQREPERRGNPPGKYLHGKQAFPKWIESLRILENLAEDERNIIMQANGMNYGCLLDSRASAADYLTDWAETAAPEVSKHLHKAADLYAEAARALSKWNWENIADQAEIIRRAFELDEQAVAELRKAA